MTALAEGFATPTREDWLKAVRAALKGEPFESLIHHTVEDLEIQPLYGPDRPPGRLRPRRPRDGSAWDIRTLVAHPDPAGANEQILDDLAGGASSVALAIGQDGCRIGSADDLARALRGVAPEAAAIALDAGFLGVQAADWLGEVAKAAPAAELRLHLDPLTAFAQGGVSPGPIEAHIAAAAAAGARLGQAYPAATSFLASGRMVYEASGSIPQELGVMASSALAYAKASAQAGLTVEQAFGGIVLGLAVDGDVLQSIAKLRAARDIWDRIALACGAPRPARIEARSSRRMLTALDPFTNLIRLTAAGFAAAAGGADAILLHPFTDALGPPDARARRLSRNIQLILLEESHLGQVDDPAAGSWAIESLTDELAREGWGVFQAIEAQGGIVAALSSGFIASNVDAVRMAREAAVADGALPVLGVTLHPDPGAAALELPEVEAPVCALPDPRLPGPDGACPPLQPVRTAATAEMVAEDLET